MSTPATESGGSLPYEVNPQEPYGTRWRDNRPPGLPVSARHCSVPYGGVHYMRESAARLTQRYMPTMPREERVVWLAGLLALAINESRAMIGRPANNFNALPPSERGGESLITAWGIWQYNRDAFRGLAEPKSYLQPQDIVPDYMGARAVQHYDDAMPWQCTTAQEVDYPIVRAIGVAQKVFATTSGADAQSAYRGLRAVHSGSSRLRHLLRNGRTKREFDRTWTTNMPWVGEGEPDKYDEHDGDLRRVLNNSEYMAEIDSAITASTTLRR